jgi:phosphoribosylanthranilate isomerase
MTRVKICGITTVEDAAHALLCGADFLGFIFYPPSPRGITIPEAAELMATLRQRADTGPLLRRPDRPRLVGVFVNESAAAVADTLNACGLDLAQLSGDEQPEVVADAASPLAGRAYQALRPQSTTGAAEAAARYSAPTSDSSPTLLLDTYHPALRGGTGETVDWHLAAELRHLTPRLMLAGGLSPDNVAEAVRQVRPFAVDVASGVEAGPGRKDPDKVRRFITAAKTGQP